MIYTHLYTFNLVYLQILVYNRYTINFSNPHQMIIKWDKNKLYIFRRNDSINKMFEIQTNIKKNLEIMHIYKKILKKKFLLTKCYIKTLISKVLLCFYKWFIYFTNLLTHIKKSLYDNFLNIYVYIYYGCIYFLNFIVLF